MPAFYTKATAAGKRALAEMWAGRYYIETARQQTKPRGRAPGYPLARRMECGEEDGM
jgi:hypothetical protein